jgi:septum formation protein
MNAKPEIILASSSKSRLNLLWQIGINPDRIISPEIKEERIKREKPEQMAARLAKAKCLHVAKDYPNALVIGGDTVSFCAGKILDKTFDPKIAKEYMHLISGRRHSLYSSVCIALESKAICRQKTVKSVLQFKRFTDYEIDEYIASNEWQGCSGGYKTEGMIARYLKFISGSTSSIMGLPLHEVYQLLNSLDFNAFAEK